MIILAKVDQHYIYHGIVVIRHVQISFVSASQQHNSDHKKP